MRRFHAFLLTAGLLAAPASAVANPSDQPPSESRMADTFERSTNKGRLGVMVMSLTDELRSYFGASTHSGVLVARVVPGSPAARAGIAVGDVLVEVRGHTVRDAGDVIRALTDVGKDKTATLKVVRGKKPIDVDVRFHGEMTSTLDALPGFHWLRELLQLGAFDHRTSST